MDGNLKVRDGRRAAPRFALALACGALAGLIYADEVDTLAIARDFATLPRASIVVVPVPQPPKGKGKLEIADSLGRIMTEELVAALQREMPEAKVVPPDAAPEPASGLILETYFSRLVPGSRAKRFWVGFGAGKSVTEVSGEVREAATGSVVARFTHARLSWCCGFGNNDHEIGTNLANAANDIAAVVAGRFHPDQTQTWIEDPPAGSKAP